MPGIQSHNDVAVVGFAGRFPGASNVEAFWGNLANGIESVKDVPASRWDHSLYLDKQPGKPLKTYCPKGGFVDNVDLFDNAFFRISDDEAALIDPKQRLLLETAYTAMEHAGYGGDRLRGSNTGVFIGSGYAYYEREMPLSKILTPYGILGVSNTLLANRMSNVLDLQGPSYLIDTFCSSSLIAVHLACQSLLNSECSVAIAGGVHILSFIHYIALSQFRALSPDGRCRTFDKQANGFVPGEGVGVVILKPYSKALADGDEIHAVIKGAASNHSGRTHSPTSPNPNVLENVIARAYEKSGVPCETIGYVEAHGTGTELGDPLEFRALKNAFRRQTAKTGYCALGSVKTNIGHLEPAAGIAGLIKIILSLKNKKIPGLLHLKQLNRFVDLADSPFYINEKTIDWESSGPRRAGVTAIGLSGSNIHMIVEEAPSSTVSHQLKTAIPAHTFKPKKHWVEIDPATSITQRLINIAQFGKEFATCGPGHGPESLRPLEATTSENNSSVEGISRLLKEIILRKSGLDDNMVWETDTDLEDAGVDSVTKVEISVELINKYPFLEQAGDELTKAKTLGAMIAIIDRHAGEQHVPALELHEQSKDCANGLVQLLHNQKRNGANIVCKSIKLQRVEPINLVSELVVNDSHPFLFDHPLDHVSGIHLIEAMLQNVQAAYLYKQGLPETAPLFVPSINATFHFLCDKKRPISIEVEELTYKEVDDEVAVYKGYIRDGQRTLCAANFRIADITGLFSTNQKNERSHPPIKACAKERVNKHNEINVFISEPTAAIVGEKNSLSFDVVPVGSHAMFSDYHGSHIPGLYLLESFRQTQRFIDNLKKNESLSPSASRGFLMSLGISLKKPISRVEQVGLKIEQPEQQVLGNKRLVNGVGHILVHGENVGKCSAKSLLISD